jgi:hypothetical protein
LPGPRRANAARLRFTIATRQIYPVHGPSFFPATCSRIPHPRNPCPGPVFKIVGTAGKNMQDLENCLARLGYGGVRHEPECWEVAQVGNSESRNQDYSQNTHQRDLYIWMIKTTEIIPQRYRITRVTE